MELRKVEKFENGKWTEINFSKLALGDKFRMFEPTGEPVIGDKGMSEWTVTSTPYPTNKEGVMAVEIV